MLITYLSAVFIYAQLALSSSFNPQTSSDNRLQPRNIQPRDTHNANLVSEGVFLHKRSDKKNDYRTDIITGSGDENDGGVIPKPPTKRGMHTNIISGDDEVEPGHWRRYRVKREVEPNIISGRDNPHALRRHRAKREETEMSSGRDGAGWTRYRIKRGIKTDLDSRSEQ
ncbi:secreted protein [Melampsora americana]|nr:secreted protein [Melampsora americana]